ncbi:MAG: hypothetical protein H7Y00_10125 [Fimbriimonadaceae bacterium]|nr:hypothetical protein [Chitinophagales bacterium]
MNPDLLKQQNFLKRFYIYQKERYPFAGYIFLVGAFSFSAISYSRICRDADGFITLFPFLICVFNTVTLFFLVRIFDEHKDQEDDMQYRKYLPVPRGIITLKELRYVAVFIFFLQIIVNLIFYPKMLLLYAGVMIYLLLMGKEFFVRDWLKKHQFWYITSHMFIIPFIDIFASGFDWFLADVKAPDGLLLFFCVSYMNGIVLEIGRKIKAPENEEEGVLSYTKQLGSKRAPLIWILILFITILLAFAAAYYAGMDLITYIVFSLLFLLCALPAVMFFKTQNQKFGKWMEYSSALWTFGMYLTLGGIPMLISLLK